jgi:hypothetical protein
MSRLRLHPEHHLVGRIGWLRAAVMGAAQSGCFDHRDHAHISYTNRRPSLYRSLAHHPEALVQHRLAFNTHILLLTGHPSTCTANQLMCSAGLVSAITWSLQLRELTRSRCSK